MLQSNSKSLPLSRSRAFTLHLISSAAVLFAFYLFVSLVWYPDALFIGAQGLDMFKILVPVDLILGPLIMLVIFNPKKASLKFDVTCVLVFQIAFFAYGAWTLYSARPAYIVFAKEAFYLATANQMDPAFLAKVKETRFQKVPQLGPEWVATRTNLSNEEKEELAFSAVGGYGLQHFPQHYLAIDSQKQAEILSQAKPLEKLPDLSSEHTEKLKNFTNAHATVQILFIPLFTKQSTLYVALDAKTGRTLKVL
jgi:hypothetical protein